MVGKVAEDEEDKVTELMCTKAGRVYFLLNLPLLLTYILVSSGFFCGAGEEFQTFVYDFTPPLRVLLAT